MTVPTERDATAHDGRQVCFIWVSILAGMVAALHVGKIGPALPALRTELELSLVGGGFVVSAFNGVGVVLGLLAGGIADRFGHRRLLVAGLLLQGLGAVAGALATTDALLVAGRLVEGVGFVAVAVSAPAIIAMSAATRQRKRMLAIWSIYLPTGSALIVLVAPLAMAAIGWRGLWLATAVASLAWGILAWRVLPTRVPAAQRRVTLPFATVMLPRAWLLAGIFGCYSLQWLSLMVWLPTFLTGDRGLSDAVAAALTALVIGANVIGCLGGAVLLGRGVPRWRLILATATTMAGCVALIFSGLPDLLRYGACVLFSLIGGLLPAAVLGATPLFAASPGEVGAMNGMVVTGSNLGQLIGPPLVGFVVTILGGWGGAGVVMVIAALACATLALAVRSAERRLAGGAPG